MRKLSMMMGGAALILTLLIALGSSYAHGESRSNPAGKTRTTVGHDFPLPDVLKEAPQSATGIPAWNTKTLRDVALQQAVIAGDPNPISIHYVLTGRGRANQFVSQEGVDSNQAVYLVVLHGNFVYNMARMPLGASAPHGTTMTFTIDTQTGEILDKTISDQPFADLTVIGRVSTVPR